MISFITTSRNLLKVLIKKVRSPCAESTDILVSLFAALVISFKKTHKPTKTHHTTLHSHLSFFRVLMCVTCLFFLYMVCTRILIEKNILDPLVPLYCTAEIACISKMQQYVGQFAAVFSLENIVY